MPTPSQIKEQVDFERQQIKHGLKKLRDSTRQLEDKEYASASVYGAASLETLLPLVVERIQDTFSYAIIRGKNGVAFKEVHNHGINASFSIINAPMTLNEATENASDLIASISEEIIRTLKLAKQIFTE